MANRKRNIQVKFYVTAEEKELMEQKMAQLQTKRIGAYLRKMAIDGYIIQVDTRDIKEMNKLLSAIGRNINQIAKRVNAGGPTYQADMEEIRERLDQIWQLQRRILWCDAVAAASIRTRESLRDTEQRITDLSLLGKQIDTYRKLKPVYDRYKASKDKEKFLRGFESEIILFEAAAREIKKAGLTKLPSAEKLKAELGGLSARKTALQAELRKVQREEKEYDTLRQNVDVLLERPKEQEQQRQRSNNLE